ncbi:TetR/AcrR family transcriptional regulator [Paenimyroides ceti]
MENQILQKSSELFIHRGFRAVTMDDIAKEMGISKKTIYLHYQSKPDLVEASVEYFYDVALGKVEKIIENSDDVISELFDVRSAFKNILSPELQTRLMYELIKYYPKVTEKLNQKRYEQFDETILENLRKGLETGYYRKEIDIELVGRFFFVTTANLCDEKLFPVEIFPLEKVDAEFLEYHLRAIVTEKGLKKLEQILNK